MTDNEAMSLINRATILLKETGQGCLTPGAVYQSSIKSPREISIKAILSDEQAKRLSDQMEKYPHRIPYMDEILHDYFQVAVWKILEGKIL